MTQMQTADSAAALGALLDELTERIQAGEAVDGEAVIRAHPEHADALRRLLPAMQLLADVAPSAGPAHPGAAPDVAVGQLGDFRLRHELGRGGMGIVYEAEQISLNRRVALKVLPFAGALDPRQLQRFKNEALAAASLRHDHIVQVYAVGCERGVHYYAMEFVDGQTLAQFIHGLRPAEAGPPAGDATLEYDPGAAPTRPVAALSTVHSQPRGKAFYRQAAALIAQAADALEHAHAVGIVHRDVKPGNLLLDTAGKLYMSDFGLARFGPDAGLTMSGDLLGTLRYMAPEQALARHGLVDHRADIYGLGCTLYELLTGRPAVDATERAEILRKIAFEEPVAPRKLHPAVPLELQTITLKCLAKNPAERYATAGELADDLRRWLTDKTIAAKPPTLWQRAAKWARRHRAAVGATAAVLLLAAAMLGAGVAWVARDAATRMERAEHVVRAALDDVDQFQGQSRWPEALDAARRADGLLSGGAVGDELRRRVQEALAGLTLVARLDDVRQKKADETRGWADGEFGRVFREAGIDVDTLGPDQVAERVPPAVRAPVAAALDEWVSDRTEEQSRQRLAAIARAVDPDEWRTRLREALVKQDREALLALADRSRLDDLPAASLVALAKGLSATVATKGVAVLRRAQQRHPTDFWANHELATSLMQTQPHRPAEASRYATAAVALRPHSPQAFIDLGHTLSETGDTDAAVGAFREAIRLRPDHHMAHYQLGACLLSGNDPDGALAAIREGIRLYPDSHWAFLLGSALLAKGDLDGAIAVYRDVVRRQRNNGIAHNQLGHALRRKGDWAGAAAAHQEALRVYPGFHTAHIGLACALMGQGDRDGTVAAVRTALEALETERRQDPTNEEVHRIIAWFLAAFPDERVYDPQRAVEAARTAIRIAPEDWQCWDVLALAYYRAGDWAAAIAAAEKVLQLHSEPIGSWLVLALAHGRRGERAEALRWYEMATRSLDRDRIPDPILRSLQAEVAELFGIAAGLKGAKPPPDGD